MKINNEHQQHFLGKVCTVFTTPINRDFQQENPNRYPDQLYKYFVGVVEDISDYGLLLTQATTGLKTWLFLPHVIAIAEEEVEYLTEDEVQVVEKPAEARISDLQGQFPNEFPELDKDDPRVNVEALSKIAELVKKQTQQKPKNPDDISLNK